MKYNLSASTIKAFDQHETNKYCGKRFKAVKIDKTHEELTGDAARLGQYFESIVNGLKNRPADTTQKGELTAPYKKAVQAAEKTRERIVNIFGDSPTTFDVNLEKDGNKAIFDILIPDKHIIIDLKYSGLLGNKWEEFGWHPSTIGNSSHMTQAKFYIWFYYQIYGVIPSFFYYVQSSTDSDNFQVFSIKADEAFVNSYNPYYYREMIDYKLSTNGFVAEPVYDQCLHCPLNNECKEKAVFPTTITVDLCSN